MLSAQNWPLFLWAVEMEWLSCRLELSLDGFLGLLRARGSSLPKLMLTLELSKVECKKVWW